MMIDLREPSPAYEATFFAGFSTLTSDTERYSWFYAGPSRYKEFRELPFSEYVEQLLYLNNHPPEGFVKGIIWWAFMGHTMVGRISLRKELNDTLRLVGGHIGYIVAPDYRGRGFATEMLRQVLRTSAARAIGKLLITCDEDNLASERTILKNGGIFDSIVDEADGGKRKKRFWINLYE